MTDASSISPNFERCARLLDQLPYRKGARCFYEAMSGGLMWDDEKVKLPFSELGWFRAVLSYRSSVILGVPRSQYAPIWDALQRAAPNWPGFRSDRCTAEPESIKLLNGASKRFVRNLNRIDAAVSGDWRPLSGKGEQG